MRSSALAHSSLALVLALALAACGGAETAPPADGGGSSVDGGSPRADGGTARDGGTTSDGGTAADGGPIVVPTCPSGGGATVSGTYQESDVSSDADGGVSDNGADLRSSVVAALVPRDGGFCIVQGTGAGNGNFTINNVPAGPYYVQVDTEYLVTSSRTIDFGYSLSGRYDVSDAQSETPMVFNVTGLDPWQADDFLELYSVGAGVSIFAPEAGDTATGAPVNGATALSAFTFDYSWEANPAWLIDGSAGDTAILAQLVAQPPSGQNAAYSALAKAFAPTSFTMADGRTTTLAGAFTTVARNQTVNVAWKRSLFDGYRTAVNPDATPADHYFSLYTLPLAASRGVYSTGASLVSYGPTAGNTDVSLGSVSFGSPYPSTWDVYGSIVAIFAVDYALGSADPYTEAAFVSVDAPRATFAAGSVEPVISPVQQPKVNGQDAFGTLTGAGRMPTVSWNAPARGTATSYAVVVSELSVSAGATDSNVVASITTTGTSIVLPPNVLAAGKTYYLAITAYAAPGIDATVHPYRSTLPQASATALTGQLTP